MPPALSDNEESDQSDFASPARTARKASAKSPSTDDTNGDEDILNVNSADNGSEDEEEGDDDDEDVFIVEKINKHIIDEDGTLKFQVKWEGYESKKDLTWEPEENLLESASEVLDEYFAKKGGRDAIFEETEKAAKGKKRRRATNGAATPATTTKRSRKNAQHPAETTPPVTAKKWSPPAGSWEDEIDTIDACEDEGSGKLVVYLIWKNGQKTKHDTGTIYKKCPQKMLQFYERHVKIIKDESKASIEQA